MACAFWRGAEMYVTKLLSTGIAEFQWSSDGEWSVLESPPLARSLTRTYKPNGTLYTLHAVHCTRTCPILPIYVQRDTYGSHVCRF